MCGSNALRRRARGGQGGRQLDRGAAGAVGWRPRSVHESRTGGFARIDLGPPRLSVSGLCLAGVMATSAGNLEGQTPIA